MEITEILQKIVTKRTECIMQDRMNSIPALEALIHLALDLDKAKEHPIVEEHQKKKTLFYKALEKLPIVDRPFKVQ